MNAIEMGLRGEVIVLSGLPGSGKTTYARLKLADAAIISADDFFVGPDGYKFDPTRIAEAHRGCWRRFYERLCEGEPRVVVDNTNLTAAEIAPYVLPAQVMQYDVRIVRINCDPFEAFRRQTHGVPSHIYMQMIAAWVRRDLVPWWKVEEVTP